MNLASRLTLVIVAFTAVAHRNSTPSKPSSPTRTGWSRTGRRFRRT